MESEVGGRVQSSEIMEWIQIRVPKEIRDRLEKLRESEFEPMWALVKKALDRAEVKS